MADIRPFIKDHLLEPLKQYPTIIQDTMIEIITQKLQLLYDYAIKFPEIVSPNKSRLDILKAIADQFLFTVREEADIQEQIDILDHIIYVYNKRGSIDTIENMWKYYGGDLPKDVQVIIPSYKLFRYSLSRLSGTHVFQDNTVNRTGVYEIKLINNYYPVPELRDFLLKELVAAGNLIYFTNDLHMNISPDDILSNAYKYIVYNHTVLDIQMTILKSNQGLTWSGYNTLSRKGEDHYWSGRGSIFVDLIKVLDTNTVEMNKYLPFDIGLLEATNIQALCRIYTNYSKDIKIINELLYCTPASNALILSVNSYNSQDEPIESPYSGYFILGESSLGELII